MTGGKRRRPNRVTKSAVEKWVPEQGEGVWLFVCVMEEKMHHGEEREAWEQWSKLCIQPRRHATRIIGRCLR